MPNLFSYTQSHADIFGVSVFTSILLVVLVYFFGVLLKRKDAHVFLKKEVFHIFFTFFFLAVLFVVDGIYKEVVVAFVKGTSLEEIAIQDQDRDAPHLAYASQSFKTLLNEAVLRLMLLVAFHTVLGFFFGALSMSSVGIAGVLCATLALIAFGLPGLLSGIPGYGLLKVVIDVVLGFVPGLPTILCSPSTFIALTILLKLLKELAKALLGPAARVVDILSKIVDFLGGSLSGFSRHSEFHYSFSEIFIHAFEGLGNAERSGFLAFATLWLRKLLLDIFIPYFIPMVFFFGLLLRLFFFTRKTGTSLLALAIAFYYIFPATTIFSHYMYYDIYKGKLSQREIEELEKSLQSALGKMQSFAENIKSEKEKLEQEAKTAQAQKKKEDKNIFSYVGAGFGYLLLFLGVIAQLAITPFAALYTVGEVIFAAFAYFASFFFFNLLLLFFEVYFTVAGYKAISEVLEGETEIFTLFMVV